MGFFPSRADSDLWMKDYGRHYEYFCTWVDDIIAASKNPSTILRQFITEANYKLKAVGEPTYHLGGDFGRVNTTLLPNKKSTCYLSAKTYIERVCEKIEIHQLCNYHTIPMSPDYHPEIDESTILTPEMTSK